MVGQHLAEIGGHGVSVEEVVVEGVVGVEPLTRVQTEQLVQQVKGILVPHIRLQAVLHLKHGGAKS